MGRISTSSRYVIYIVGRDLLFLGELGGGVLIRKNYKNGGLSNLRTVDQIIMKFGI